MNIRPATPKDVPAIATLIDRHAKKSEVLPRSNESIKATLVDWVVAEDAGDIRACGSLRRYAPNLAEIRSLVVHENARGNGVGISLLQGLIAQAHQSQIPTVFALTHAVQLFIRAGFQLCDKARFPEKIWLDCSQCSFQDHCRETPVILSLNKDHPRSVE